MLHASWLETAYTCQKLHVDMPPILSRFVSSRALVEYMFKGPMCYPNAGCQLRDWITVSCCVLGHSGGNTDLMLPQLPIVSAYMIRAGTPAHISRAGFYNVLEDICRNIQSSGSCGSSFQPLPFCQPASWKEHFIYRYS